MSDILQLCVVEVGGQGWAVDVHRVKHISRPTALRPLHHGPSWIEGVIERTGEVIPVVDLRRRLGAPLAPLGPKSRLVHVRVEGQEIALLVDRVVEVLQVPRRAVVPPPRWLAGEAAPFVLGLVESEENGVARHRFLVHLQAVLGTAPTASGDLP